MSTELWGMPEAREWDVELPKGVFHATEWIAAGFSACVDGGSAPLGGEGRASAIQNQTLLGIMVIRVPTLQSWLESRSYI